MIRITSGKYRGRVIESPPRTKDIRPTTSLMRESVFSSLQHYIPGCRFLDLFAGSGIMGLEAMSRGATFVMAVEQEVRQCRSIRKNYQHVGVVESDFTIVPMDVWQLLGRANRKETFDVAFLDPPYGFAKLSELVGLLQANGWLTEQGVIVLEHGSREPDLPGFTRRMYGDSSLSMHLPE